ncbi:MAG: cytochrome d ubiquinol oxidase subunit II [Pseudomonadota bacterium]
MTGLEYWLPVIFFFLMGIALFLYIILDGYDLGIGLLFPLASAEEKNVMTASIGPFWDANETWIVLGVGILVMVFHNVQGSVLASLYLPVTFMLVGLIIRGVAFDFRLKAGLKKQNLWNQLFFLGSLIASTCQGWMLGSYITGMTNTPINILFSFLIAISLPFVYIVLGASWLLIKTEGELFDKSLRWARHAIIPMGIAFLAISIATPLVSENIAEKWFTLQNFIGLLPIPLASALVFIGITWLLSKPEILKAGWEWMILFGMVIICIMAAIGLAYSLFPYIILDKVTLWEAAGSTDSLLIILVGTCIALPSIIAYTIFIYYIFRGKATHLTYGEN